MTDARQHGASTVTDSIDMLPLPMRLASPGAVPITVCSAAVLRTVCVNGVLR